MFEVEDEPTETLHIYVIREAEAAPQPSLIPAFLLVGTLCLVIAMSVLIPYQPPVMRAVIRVPAVLLPARTFTAVAQVSPTGVKTYPATTARGVLTITNGSIIAQILPAGFTTVSQAYVPAGSANGYGLATVAAHALLPGTSGNIPANAINQIEGSSVYIRNLLAFRD